MPRRADTDKNSQDDFILGHFRASDDPEAGLLTHQYEALRKGASALMLSGGTGDQSDFSSSEEDELNGNDLNRTLQGAQGVLHIKDLIGRGAFGSVYRATWKGLPAAVKVRTMQQCLVREVSCMQRLYARAQCCSPSEPLTAHALSGCRTKQVIYKTGSASQCVLNTRVCMQVIEHDDEETHASFSPLSTGVSLRSFSGTPSAAEGSTAFSPPSPDLGYSQGVISFCLVSI